MGLRGEALRLELFVADLAASLDFYCRVLGFTREPERSGGYTPLRRGSVRLAFFRVTDPDGDYWRVTSRG